MAPFARFRDPWITTLQSQLTSTRSELPEYAVSDPGSLILTSRPRSFEVGTGASIYARSLLPAILNAKKEVILVTCFWAPSSTLTCLSKTLEALAAVRQERVQHENVAGPDEEVIPPLKIRICFSSRSLFQKLLHTSSRDGYTYPPSSWATKLGLPSPEVLEAGRIDLQVKSLFFLPFSVMHPKFLIIDRQKAWLPSCNVSWESWLEGCVEIAGDAVQGLLRFYYEVWDRDLKRGDQGQVHEGFESQCTNLKPPQASSIGLSAIQSPASFFIRLEDTTLPTVLLPSSHHRNPQFRPFPWQSSSKCPPTPLNYAVLRLLEMAERNIYVQTPNLTCAAVLDALLDALDRGVNVTIVTSKNQMVLEQLLTAGTTTSLCLKSLIRRYDRLRDVRWPRDIHGDDDSRSLADVEAQIGRRGSLKISYFRPRPENRAKGVPEEPVHSHLKLTIVDGQFTILGSGNMDRASWFTSQELGVLFQSIDFVAAINNALDEALDARLDTWFKS
ncbi:hypothetical protein F5Y15DRAFT_337091 [Xylariaceae sp. FL0016]|nr:hypothetical protein F5Y15DRAFT_337091 [Xylariaceae sp. FL0016]